MLGVVLFAYMWSSNHLFTHKHIVNNNIVSHSHPYSQNRTHDHSSSELNFYSAIALLVVLGVSSLAFCALLRGRHFVYQSVDLVAATVYCGQRRLFRGPPAC